MLGDASDLIRELDAYRKGLRVELRETVREDDRYELLLEEIVGVDGEIRAILAFEGRELVDLRGQMN